jgi:hypothetical protein
MGEDSRPILGNVFVEQNAGLGIAQQACRRGLEESDANDPTRTSQRIGRHVTR